MFKIVEKKALAAKVNKFVVVAEDIAKKAKPGQFVIIRTDEKGERIPITIADTDLEKGTLTLYIQEVGKSTMQMGKLKNGDFFLDVCGPLGVPSHLDKFGTVVGIGGGFGIAALYPIMKALKNLDNKVISIIGARSKDLLIMEEEMKNVSNELLISTDDGSKGQKGLVVDVLKNILTKPIDLIYAIGPVVMMKAVCSITKPAGIKTIVSLNPIMVDGTGMCGVCRCSIGGKTKFACVDGPDFDGHLVDWDELLKRQRTYLSQEKLSVERYVESLTS